MLNKLWVLYDSRCTFEANVLCSASTLKEAKKDQELLGGYLFEYDVERVEGETDALINEREVPL